MPNYIQHNVSNCSHPLFKKKGNSMSSNKYQIDSLENEKPNKKIPETYDTIKNAVTGNSMTKKK